MKYLSALLLLFLLSFSQLSLADANDNEPTLSFQCTMVISGHNYRNTVIEEEDKAIRLGYSVDPNNRNDLQNLFALNNLAPEVKSLGRATSLARLYRQDNGRAILEIGFYKASITSSNSPSEGVQVVTGLSNWQFNPLLLYRYELDINGSEVVVNPIEKINYRYDGVIENYALAEAASSSLQINLNASEASRLSGTTLFPIVELGCNFQNIPLQV